MWNVHKAFDQPGRIHTQILELPDGERYFSLARTVRRAIAPWGRPEAVFAVALACDLKSSERLVYSSGLDLRNPNATPIGVNCRVCPRAECPQRAAPALGREPRDSEFVKTLSPFGFGEPVMPVDEGAPSAVSDLGYSSSSQPVVDRGRRDRSLAGGDRELVEPGDHVARGIEPVDRRLLVLVDDQRADLVLPRPEVPGEARAHLAAEGRVEDVDPVPPSVGEDGLDLVAVDDDVLEDGVQDVDAVGLGLLADLSASLVVSRSPWRRS